MLASFPSDMGEGVSSFFTSSSFSILSLIGFTFDADFFVDSLPDFLAAGVFLVVFNGFSDFFGLAFFVVSLLVDGGLLVTAAFFGGVFVPFFFAESSFVVGDFSDGFLRGDDGSSDSGGGVSEPFAFDPLVNVVGEFVDVRFFLLSISGLA